MPSSSHDLPTAATLLPRSAELLLLQWGSRSFLGKACVAGEQQPDIAIARCLDLRIENAKEDTYLILS